MDDGKVTKNFGFLAVHSAQLVRLAAMAERFFHDDPATSLIKLRQFAELLAKTIAARHASLAEERETFEGVLIRLREQNVLPREVSDVFHHLRRTGNTAVHEGRGNATNALSALKLARELAVWFHRSYGSSRAFEAGPFIPPVPPKDASAELKAELDSLRNRLTTAERAVLDAETRSQEIIRHRESTEERLKREQEDREFWQAYASDAEASRIRAERELAELQKRGADLPDDLIAIAQLAAARIVVDETDTRAIIDAQLIAAGWKVDSSQLRHGVGTRPDPGTAIAISEWPTASGPVDYALFIKGRCVGVIEAKRTARDVPAALTQAKRYASDIALEPQETHPNGPWQHGLDPPFPVPFVFATNGRSYVKQLETKSGIWFWDARLPENQSQALPEWFSPRDLTERLQQDVSTSVEGMAEDAPDVPGLRPYQIDAINAVEAAIGHGQRNILVAMATGTGKTRTCIALMYRLLKRKRFRRILFLVDRNALGQQTEEALDNTEVEGLLKFSQTYGVAGRALKMPEQEDRVHVATVQSLVKRILYSQEGTERPTPGLYDCIVVDEAHRGYTLDAELREEDIEFRNTEDYLSKYRRVLDFFDAVKIGLTATPARHTTEIFGHAVYHYSYRRAVVEGYLIDHLPPRRITTALSLTGITFQGGENVDVIDPRTGQIDLFETEDTVAFEVQEFNKRVYTREFNRVVAEAVAADVPPDAPGKTLIFAARDDHADILVDELKKALVAEYGPQPEAIVQKITGTVDRPTDRIKVYRNDPLPKYVVTVDLLTTGIDIPAICNLVFVRRVNSRILYEQMLGRATRRSDEIGKEHFRIFDAVDIYANMQTMTDMRPVVVNPAVPLATLVGDLARAPDESEAQFVREQVVVKLRRKLARLSLEQRDAVERLAKRTPEELLTFVRTAPVRDVSAALNALPKLIAFIDALRTIGSGDPGIFISAHADELISVTDVFEGRASPEDYIAAFEAFVRQNMNAHPAMIAATQRPRELTRKELKELATLLDDKGFSEASLRRAYGQARNADIAAHIIGFVRQAAVGDPLVPYDARVEAALKKIEASRDWTQKQKQWLRRIGRALKEQPVGDRETLEQPVFRQHGGFDAIDRDFANGLENVLKDLNDAIWSGTAA